MLINIKNSYKNLIGFLLNERTNYMYHHYSKNDQYLRKALYEEYDKKCFYCGDTLQPKNMHVDHILASNYQHNSDETFNDYLNELIQNGFIFDCVENYFPTCSSCNLKKNNKKKPSG